MARRSATDDFRFEGFESPNTTPVPDVVFDRLLARLGEAEIKALLYIIRRTFGFKKDRDPISFNQFLRGITTLDGRSLDEGCGVRDRTTLSKALKSLEAKGIVTSEKGTDERGENTTTVYRLRFRDAASAAVGAQPTGVVGNSYHRGRENPPPVVGNSYPQETALQQTERQDSNVRMTSHNEKPIETKSRAQAGPEPRPVGAPAGDAAQMQPLGEAIAAWQQRHRQRTTAADRQSDEQPATGGLERDHHRAPRRSRPRQAPQRDVAYQVIQTYIADFARELNDRAPLKVSTTRAYNLYKRSGLDLNAFVAQLYAARAIVKERAATIRTQGGENAAGFAVKHRAGYYFAVLEDLLGLREPSPASPPPRSAT